MDDLEITLVSEVNQIKTNIWCHLNVDSKNKIQMNLLAKQKQTYKLRKQIYGYQMERRKKEIRNLRLTYTHYCIK